MMWPLIANGLTFVRNFSGPSLILAGLGLVAGAVPTWLIARGVYTGTIADLRVELAELRESNAIETASRIERAARENAANAETLRRQLEQITAALTSAGPQIRAAVRELAAAQKELSSDPRYACRREPLPAEHIERLRLPAE